MKEPNGRVNYVHIVPNSQSFMSLVNILYLHKYKSEEFNKDYILVGLKNTLERGLEIQKVDTSKKELPIICRSIFDLTQLIEEDQNLSDSMLITIINNTLDSGYDLKPKHNMETQEVYNRIDGELEYQQQRWVVRREANGTPDESKPPAEWLSYIRKHVRLADDAIYNLDDEEALAQFRKVAALAVRALTIHGCPERVIPENEMNEA